MAFDLFELGRFTGRPVHLFVFRRQGLTWRYWAGDEDREFGGHLYRGAQIQRSEIKQTTERAKDRIKITMAYVRAPDALEYPSTQELGDNWFPYVPTDTMSVMCLATHIGDVDPPAIEWQGVVTQPKFTDTELELTCEPDNGVDRARNQGAKWQRGCWKTVYSTGPRGCNLNPAAHTVQGTIERLEQTSSDTPPQAHVVVPELISHLTALVGRTARWTDGGGIERTSTILAAYFAYEWRRVFVGLGVHVTEGFSWEDGTTLTDQLSSPIERITYTKRPALVLADATGLAEDSAIEVDFPATGITAALTDVDGLLMTAPEFADSIFTLAGGYLTYTTASGLVIRRPIVSHGIGSETLQLAPGGPNPEIDDLVTVLPGCPRTWAACAARGNTPHYGGAIYKPGKNPKEDSMSWG
ncbi:DUF2163 domain-containing protein [Pseudoxanthomonas sp. LH2527]|uniref:phage BR0599 family protein n=1 Tax=Pseudoxanthomonas sp. LH2527 TaxID=2923249 RepID=UPI001F13B9BE|nr:phage BR0599 family protein [Pseudoxanthomonas sp. LH2527]MCH6484238.1 DUF2163 domain-containing protein [Pseudoxanthomonas sp. LH2527]